MNTGMCYNSVKKQGMEVTSPKSHKYVYLYILASSQDPKVTTAMSIMKKLSSDFQTQTVTLQSCFFFHHLFSVILGYNSFHDPLPSFFISVFFPGKYKSRWIAGQEIGVGTAYNIQCVLVHHVQVNAWCDSKKKQKTKRNTI